MLSKEYSHHKEKWLDMKELRFILPIKSFSIMIRLICAYIFSSFSTSISCSPFLSFNFETMYERFLGLKKNELSTYESHQAKIECMFYIKSQSFEQLITYTFIITQLKK
mgnify:CR=1 FL=1